MRIALLLVLTAGMIPARVAAQGWPDPAEQAQIRLGPIGLTPSLTVTSLVDSNVFRDSTASQDMVITVSPATRAWLRLGRTRLTLDGQGAMVYFRRYSGEGSLDGSIGGRYEVSANRLTPWVEGRVLRGRQRVGYDIDARAQHGERGRGAGVDVRVGAKTELGVYGRAVDYWYDAEARFLETDLRDTLNRRSTIVGLSVRQRLTPLTTLAVQAETVRDRFAVSTTRDSDSRRVLAGLDMGSTALVSGRIRLGYRTFEAPHTASTFGGVVGSAEAVSTAGERVRIVLAADRELEYSFDITSPYYVRTGARGGLAVRVTRHWEIDGRAGREQLAYRGSGEVAGRSLYATTYGGGLAYRVGDRLRVGVTMAREERSVRRGLRDYRGYRMGLSMTYGG